MNTDADLILESTDADRYGEEPGWLPLAGETRVGSYRRGLWSRPSDRADGSYPPYYETEWDLQRIRAAARNVEAFSSIADAVLKILRGYVVGKGFAFKAAPKKAAGEAARPLADAVQRFLNQLADRNRLKALIDDCHRQGRIDGEFPVAVFPGRDGLPRFRAFDPGCVTEPRNVRGIDAYAADVEGRAAKVCWKYGVRTEIDPDTGLDLTGDPLGYHVLYDPDRGYGEYVPRERMELFRRNVPVMAKRGVSDLFKPLADLEREAKLNRNSTEGMTILAAIAFIKEYEKGPPQSTATGGDAITAVRGRQDGGARSVEVTKFYPGTIPKLFGAKYQPGPMASMNTGALRDVANACLRRIGIPEGMPGWMLTGDTETALYSSVLAMGSPFVNAREWDQAFLRDRWLALVWKALRVVSCRDWFGATLEEVERLVEVECVVPAVAIEGGDAKATRLTTEVNGGWKSRQTACEEGGGDWEVEKARIKKERAEGFGQPPAAASSFVALPAPAPQGSGACPGCAGKAGGPLRESADALLSPEAVRRAVRAVYRPGELLENCGTGDGGFKAGNDCQGGGGGGGRKASKGKRRVKAKVPGLGEIEGEVVGVKNGIATVKTPQGRFRVKEADLKDAGGSGGTPKADAAAKADAKPDEPKKPAPKKRDPKKMTIQQADAALREKGHKIVGVEPYDLAAKQARYKVEGPDGATRTLTAGEIKDIATKPAASTPAAPAPKAETPKAPEPSRGFADRKAVRAVDQKNPPGAEPMRKATASIPDADKHALRRYTAGDVDYRGINQSLREGTPLSGKAKADFEAVDAAVRKAGPLPEGTTVYRGLALDAGEQAALVTRFRAAAAGGGSVEMPGLHSTSVDPVAAAGFARSEGRGAVVFEIKPKRGAYLTDLSGFDEMARKSGGVAENEVLLPHGGKYRVAGVQDDVSIGKKAKKGWGYTVIQLEEVDG